jgi:hypothetical protein
MHIVDRLWTIFNQLTYVDFVDRNFRYALLFFIEFAEIDYERLELGPLACFFIIEDNGDDLPTWAYDCLHMLIGCRVDEKEWLTQKSDLCVFKSVQFDVDAIRLVQRQESGKLTLHPESFSDKVQSLCAWFYESCALSICLMLRSRLLYLVFCHYY